MTVVPSVRRMSKGVLKERAGEKKNRSNNYNPHTSSRRTSPHHPYMQAVSKRVYKLGDGETGRLSPHARVKSDQGFIIPEARVQCKYVGRPTWRWKPWCARSVCSSQVEEKTQNAKTFVCVSCATAEVGGPARLAKIVSLNIQT